MLAFSERCGCWFFGAARLLVFRALRFYARIFGAVRFYARIFGAARLLVFWSHAVLYSHQLAFSDMSRSPPVRVWRRVRPMRFVWRVIVPPPTCEEDAPKMAARCLPRREALKPASLNLGGYFEPRKQRLTYRRQTTRSILRAPSQLARSYPFAGSCAKSAESCCYF